VREIADAAGVNLAMVSYHFSGKEGLFAACIEPYGMQELEMTRRLLQPALAQSEETFRSTLHEFCQQTSALRLSMPEVSIIVSRDCESGMTVAEKLFRETFLQSMGLVTDFFVAAARAGVIRSDVDPLHAAGLLLGALQHVLRYASMVSRYKQRDVTNMKYRDKLFTEWLDMLWNGMGQVTPSPHKRKRASS